MVSLSSLLGDLKVAIGFLTRVPVRVEGEVSLARAMALFPLVGAGVGAVQAAVFAAAILVLPPFAAALLALLAGVLLTGGLHEDGLADFADGLGARGGREQRLAAMRDSRIGVYGVLALVFAVGLKASALHAPAGMAGLVAAGAVSRGILPAVMRALGPARADGLGAGAGMPSGRVAVVAAGLAGAVCLAALGPPQGGVALLLAGVIAGVVAMTAARRFGGFTGDVLGAAALCVETVVLLVAGAA